MVAASPRDWSMMPRGKTATIGLNLIGTALWCAALLICVSPAVARAQPAATPKRILAIYWDTKDYPSNVVFDQSFQAVLESSPEWIEYYSEYLDIDRFPGEAQSRFQRDHLRQKYADHTIDVVVALGDPPLNFLLKYRDDLFPRAAIIFVANKPPTPAQIVAGPGITGFVNHGPFRDTVELALNLHPHTEHVFIVSGSLLQNKIYENTCRLDLRDYESPATINYLTDLSLDDLTVKMKSLPERSLVLYVFQRAKDEQGRLFDPPDILALLARSASVPIYGMASWQVGRGIVGGYVRNMETNGARAAGIALQIANGARAQDIPVDNVTIAPMFDWRELQRWGISESHLPPGSIVRFRAPSFWDEYKWYAIAVISVVIVQSLLIMGLFINHTRRKRAEEALRESEERFRHMADTAPVMIWISGADKLYTYFNQQWLSFTGGNMGEELGNGWTRGVHPDDFERWLEKYSTAFNKREPFRMEYRLRRIDGQFRWILDSGTARFSPNGEFLGFIGSCIDITERKHAEEALEDLSGQLIRAREDECARIARELHDDLNQRMALISIELEQLGQNPPATNGNLRGQLRGILRQAADVSRDIHRISYDLHPSKLTHLGLVAAVTGLCDDAMSSHQLKIEFLHEGVPSDLPRDVSLCLYRIVQECLNNVIKHSGAEDAKVELRRTENEVRLSLSDSGIGFDVESARSKGGLGLISMRERLRLVGGDVAIHSQPSQGTQINVSVPLNGRRDG